MTFSQWIDLVKQAGADINPVDPGWLQHQFNHQQSPGQVAQAIKNGMAPGIPIPQPVYHQPQQQYQPNYQQPSSDATKAMTYGCFGMSGAVIAMILIPIILMLIMCGGCFGCAAIGSAVDQQNSRSHFEK